MIEWSPPTDERHRRRAGDRQVRRLDVGLALSEIEPALHHHVADIGGLEDTEGSDAQHVLVGPDAFDRPDGSRPEACARAVGDAKVHGNADQSDVERLQDVATKAVGDEGAIEEGRRIGEGPGPAVRAAEHLVRHPLEVGVVDVAAGRVGIALAQAGEAVGVKGHRLAMQA